MLVFVYIYDVWSIVHVGFGLPVQYQTPRHITLRCQLIEMLWVARVVCRYGGCVCGMKEPSFVKFWRFHLLFFTANDYFMSPH